jgi:hypothetical protein
MKDERNRSTKQYEEAPQLLQSQFASRQSNVLPLDAVRNEGRFYGRLLRGGRPLSGSQRIGFVLLGFIACAQAFFVVCGAFPELTSAVGMRPLPNSNRAALLAYLPFGLLNLLVGCETRDYSCRCFHSAVGRSATPDKLRYRTSAVLELHMYGKGVTQALGAPGTSACVMVSHDQSQKMEFFRRDARSRSNRPSGPGLPFWVYVVRFINEVKKLAFGDELGSVAFPLPAQYRARDWSL